MRTSIILYRTYDADLMGLYYQVGNKAFMSILKDALRASLNVDYSPKTEIPPMIAPYDEDCSRITISLCVTSRKDSDILMLFDRIAPRKLGQFVKAALRFYLGSNRILSCFTDNTVSIKDITGVAKETKTYIPAIEEAIERVISKQAVVRLVEPAELVEKVITQEPVPIHTQRSVITGEPVSVSEPEPIKENTNPIIKDEPVFMEVGEDKDDVDLGMNIYEEKQSVSEDTSDSEEMDILQMLDNL